MIKLEGVVHGFGWAFSLSFFRLGFGRAERREQCLGKEWSGPLATMWIENRSWGWGEERALEVGRGSGSVLPRAEMDRALWFPSLFFTTRMTCLLRRRTDYFLVHAATHAYIPWMKTW